MLLTYEMHQKRLEEYKHNIKLYERLRNKLQENKITEVETSLCLFNPKTRLESKDWVFPREKSSRVLHPSFSQENFGFGY